MRSWRRNHSYSIGDLSRRSGLSVRTIRFYSDVALATPKLPTSGMASRSGVAVTIKMTPDRCRSMCRAAARAVTKCVRTRASRPSVNSAADVSTNGRPWVAVRTRLEPYGQSIIVVSEACQLGRDRQLDEFTDVATTSARSVPLSAPLASDRRHIARPSLPTASSVAPNRADRSRPTSAAPRSFECHRRLHRATQRYHRSESIPACRTLQHPSELPLATKVTPGPTQISNSSRYARVITRGQSHRPTPPPRGARPRNRPARRRSRASWPTRVRAASTLRRTWERR